MKDPVRVGTQVGELMSRVGAANTPKLAEVLVQQQEE